MFYLFFVSLFFNMLQACEIVNILYVDDSKVLRSTTAKQVQSYNFEALSSLLPFLKNRGVTTLKKLISFSSHIDNNEMVTLINSAISTNSDSKILAKLNEFKILKKGNKVTLSTLIAFLKERDTSTTYQIALAKLIDLALSRPLTFQERTQRRFSELGFLSNIDLAPTTPTKLINFTLLEDGNQITLKALTHIHLVWCDIQMPGEAGNVALARLQNEAQSSNFRLPPFTAITSLRDYHNSDEGTPASKTLEEGFITGQNKVKKEDIPVIFEFCEKTLGTSWLRTHVGSALKPVSVSLRDNWMDQPVTDSALAKRSRIAETVSYLAPYFTGSRRTNPVNAENDFKEDELDQPAFTPSKKHKMLDGNSILPIDNFGSLETAEKTFNSDRVFAFAPSSPRNTGTHEITPASNPQQLSPTNSITEERNQLYIPENSLFARSVFSSALLRLT